MVRNYCKMIDLHHSSLIKTLKEIPGRRHISPSKLLNQQSRVIAVRMMTLKLWQSQSNKRIRLTNCLLVVIRVMKKALATKSNLPTLVQS
jgi:hypothetical protein